MNRKHNLVWQNLLGLCFLLLNDSKMNRSDIRKSPDYIFHVVENSEYRENLEQIHKSEAKFSVKNLVHDTSLRNFVSIIYQQKMIGGKREIKDTGKFALSWWGISVDSVI